MRNNRSSERHTLDNATYPVPGGTQSTSIHRMTYGSVCPYTLQMVSAYAGTNGYMVTLRPSVVCCVTRCV